MVFNFAPKGFRLMPKFWKCFYLLQIVLSFGGFVNDCFLECRAQISVELIIVLAAVVAVVLVLVSQMQATSSDGAKKLKDTSESVLKKIDDIK